MHRKISLEEKVTCLDRAFDEVDVVWKYFMLLQEGVSGLTIRKETIRKNS